MEYRKLLEVREDNNRVYFCFFVGSGTKIIGVPKNGCENKMLYGGTSFSELNLLETNQAKNMLTDLMRKVLLNHPKSLSCQIDCVKALTEG